MYRFSVITHRKREILDITGQIETLLQQKKNAALGICHVVVLHTTAALTTADLDPGTDLDMLDAFELLIPKLNFRHPHNPAHTPDHILSALIGTSITMMVENGALVLGTWQRVVLVELDGPRTREVALGFVPTA